MLVKTYGSAVYGVEAITITVEVNVMPGNIHYYIVGLPDNAVKESLQRVESAIKTIGYQMPRTKLVINLAPADTAAVRRKTTRRNTGGNLAADSRWSQVASHQATIGRAIRAIPW